MAMKAHCDVCGAEVQRDRGHVWANALPSNDRLRSVSATIVFHVPNARGTRIENADVCNACFDRFILGMRIVEDTIQSAMSAALGVEK